MYLKFISVHNSFVLKFKRNCTVLANANVIVDNALEDILQIELLLHMLKLVICLNVAHCFEVMRKVYGSVHNCVKTLHHLFIFIKLTCNQQ